jgi:hypothetical protein
MESFVGYPPIGDVRISTGHRHARIAIAVLLGRGFSSA